MVRRPSRFATAVTGAIAAADDQRPAGRRAPGVGGIKTEPKGGAEQEVEELINLTHLSARGIAEMSAEVLKLDRHARQTVPGAFGHSHAARRGR